jgi:23S rRNA (uracil1939-C5)-methyltransferase
MGKRRKENPVIEGLEITGIAAEGKAMGHHDGVVVFVPHAVPGDIVDVQVRSQRRRFMEAYVLRWVRRSPLRAEPFCEHFGVCGGCSWQNLPYQEQLRFKQQQVADQLVRIGHLELPSGGIRPVIGSVLTAFYRNKLEFTFAPKRWLTHEEMAEMAAESANRRNLGADERREEGISEQGGVSSENTASASDGVVRGDADSADPSAMPHSEPALGFHIPGMFDKILDVHKCWLQSDPSNAIRLEIKRFCAEHGYEFYNIREHRGLMRNIVIRTASTGEVMVIVVFAEDDRSRIDDVMSHLAAHFPEITSLMYIINTKLNDSLGDRQALLSSGRDHIFEEMEGLRFKIGPKSFYQTNSEQAYELYKVAREFAGLTGAETVYDLYTGTGTIANFVARSAGQVIGIEYVHEAIEDARENSALNGITNTIFYAGDMRKVLTDEFIRANGRPDVVILDPPRAGVDTPVIDVILRAAPDTIVYVSCNPATQARDIALMAADYRIEAVQPVDMFPHTHHVENVVKLVRRVGTPSAN